MYPESITRMKALAEEMLALSTLDEKSQRVFCSIGDKEYLTPTEAAAYLSTTPEGLIEYRAKGLRYSKLGTSQNSRVYYSKENIAKFIDQFEI